MADSVTLRLDISDTGRLSMKSGRSTGKTGCSMPVSGKCGRLISLRLEVPTGSTPLEGNHRAWVAKEVK